MPMTSGEAGAAGGVIGAAAGVATTLLFQKFVSKTASSSTTPFDATAQSVVITNIAQAAPLVIANNGLSVYNWPATGGGGGGNGGGAVYIYNYANGVPGGIVIYTATIDSSGNTTYTGLFINITGSNSTIDGGGFTGQTVAGEQMLAVTLGAA